MSAVKNTKKLLPPPGVGAARVVDIEAFRRLHAAKTSLRRMERQLGVPLTNIRKLVAGDHWQQDPDRVALFNEFHGTAIDIETGIAPPDVLERFATRANERREVAKANTTPIPERLLDTPYFLGQIEEKLALVLEEMTQEKVRQANLRELTSAASVLTEKRALLRGEPTVRITHEQALKLEEMIPELIAEAKRRGICIDGTAKEVALTPVRQLKT